MSTAVADDEREVMSLDVLLKHVETTHKGAGSDAAQEHFRMDLEDWLDAYKSTDMAGEEELD